MKKDFLNRYTSLPVLLDLLSKNQITLLSPETWEDRNDSFFIEEYKRKSKLKSVLALCFSTKRETFHHWKVFASRSSGVCIEFDRAHLLASIEEALQLTQSNTNGVLRSRDVDYRWIYELEQKLPIVEDWPFIKRKVFPMKVSLGLYIKISIILNR